MGGQDLALASAPASTASTAAADASGAAGDDGRGAAGDGAVLAMEYTAEIAKTDKGLGIYFARRVVDGETDVLAVDGFVEGVRDCDSAEADPAGGTGDGLALLAVGDVLTQVNGVDCSGLDVADTVALLRSAPLGMNTLRFRRPAAEADPATASLDEETDKAESSGSLAGSFIGALRKVKSRIRTEMDEDARREQEERERFEKQWLAEFDRFKAVHQYKWETCTYSADEFCGHVYSGSDAQQRTRLEEEYPTLMEAWKECRDVPSALPQWPAAKASTEAPVEFAAAGDSSEAPRLVRQVECCPALREALEFLRREFMWRPCHVDALARKLEELGVRSCAQLVEAMDAGARSCVFERQVQSPDLPRLTKSLCRALRSRAAQAAADRSEAAGADKWRQVLVEGLAAS